MTLHIFACATLFSLGGGHHTRVAVSKDVTTCSACTTAYTLKRTCGIPGNAAKELCRMPYDLAAKAQQLLVD